MLAVLAQTAQQASNIDAIVGVLAVVATLLLALVAATWRNGNQMGGMRSEIKSLSDWLKRVDQHMSEHDQWHMRRGDH